MPKYTNPRMTQWGKHKYMDFLHYPQFQEEHNKIIEERDKHLHTFFYFTGCRPAELLEMKREDVEIDGSRLIFRIPTFKRSKKKPIPDRRIRIVEWPNFTQWKELKELWNFIQPLPTGFYIFGWLKIYRNPRDYIIHHIGSPAYFYRHNLYSLFRLAGGSRTALKELKGSKDERSISMYDHLSKEEYEKRGRILTKAIK